jgi:hypothetical protein
VNGPPQGLQLVRFTDCSCLAGALADFVAGLVDARVEEKQAVLETIDVKERLSGPSMRRR